MVVFYYVMMMVNDDDYYISEQCALFGSTHEHHKICMQSRYGVDMYVHYYADQEVYFYIIHYVCELCKTENLSKYVEGSFSDSFSTSFLRKNS